jgi:peptide/nickel transport system substrate-binding protein
MITQLTNAREARGREQPRIMSKRLAAILGFGAALLTALPASAQKAADTMRVAINDPFSVLSTYQLPQNEAGTFYNRVYESLIAYDENKKQWVPQLAKSWTRVNPTTIEFDLNEKVRFHNGNTFDADDVVGTWAYLLDPKTKLRYKDRYDWVQKVEKLGPYKVRLTAKQPIAIDLGLIAYRFTALDIETLKSLDDAAEYGRVTPYGTGMYKVTQLDKNKGIIVERYDDYATNTDYARTPTKRIHGVFLPDRQTQIAQLLTGGVDLITNVSQDQANDLRTKPGIAVSDMPSGSFIFYALDAGGVAGNKALTDLRVRQAIEKSIDRDMIIKNIVPGGEVAQKLEVPCFPSTIACKYSVAPQAYDPEGAKKLLAEAGYPNGIDLEYSVFAPIRDIAVAMAGEMRKVGIRVSVDPIPITVYRKKQSDGQLQSWSLFSLIGKFPDASSALGVWFQGERADYFNNDPIILKAMDDGIKEMDSAKRDAIYKTAFDRINEMAYILPISSLPNVYAHSADVKILPDLLSATEQYIGDYAFK